MANDHPPPGTGFAWDQAERRLEAQLRQADALDTKAGVLLGLLAVVLALLLNGGERLVPHWLLAATLAGLGLSGMFAVSSFRAQGYRRDPSPETVWLFASREPQHVKLRLLSARLGALADNPTKLERKARSFAISL